MQPSARSVVLNLDLRAEVANEAVQSLTLGAADVSRGDYPDGDACIMRPGKRTFKQSQPAPHDESAQEIDSSAESISAFSSAASDGSPWALVRSAASVERSFRSLTVSRDDSRSRRLPQCTKLAGRITDQIWDICDGGKKLVRDLQPSLWVALRIESARQRTCQVVSQHMSLVRGVDFRDLSFQVNQPVNGGTESPSDEVFVGSLVHGAKLARSRG